MGAGGAGGTPAPPLISMFEMGTVGIGVDGEGVAPKKVQVRYSTAGSVAYEY